MSNLMEDIPFCLWNIQKQTVCYSSTLRLTDSTQFAFEQICPAIHVSAWLQEGYGPAAVATAFFNFPQAIQKESSHCVVR